MDALLFLTAAGLVGMVLMALPGLGRHGRVGAPGHSAGHLTHAGGHVGHLSAGHAPAGHSASGHSMVRHAPAAGQAGRNPMWLIPSPRVIFSLMTLIGAFGYAIASLAHLRPLVAGLVAIAPAILVERGAINPLWNFLLRFEGTPSVSLDDLVLTEATAVTPFYNGRGMVGVDHDGRFIQLRAELAEAHRAIPVHVGDRLFIEEVDAANERVTVSPHGAVVS